MPRRRLRAHVGQSGSMPDNAPVICVSAMDVLVKLIRIKHISMILRYYAPQEVSPDIFQMYESISSMDFDFVVWGLAGWVECVGVGMVVVRDVRRDVKRARIVVGLADV